MRMKGERTGVRGEGEESLEQLHGRIQEGMAELTLLTDEFKVRQEGHFLRTFMGVLERMGNDLVVAQEAYRNIDIDIKREKYYQEIAVELSFFKQECFTLKAQHLQLTTHAKAAALEQEYLYNQLNSLKHTL